ncbi:hypothetical protein [Neisseria subflava]|uniref:hypothetical protein n=1 Tax=Neisseria subflava TaxID=28449 RepID=UPI002029E8D1|nr:hypothetical protein [Neisseria subflava]MCL9763214.1 hypothetical protein [Neisseria subflava]
MKDLNLKSIVKFFWHFVWLLIIGLLCYSPLYFIKYDFQNQNLPTSEYNKIEIKLPTNPKKSLNCKEEADKLNCVAWNKILQDIKIELDEYHKNNVEIQNIRLDNHDKNLDILTFVISLYAILITVISIFFSLKESQRIDSGLQDIEKKFADYQSQLESHRNELIQNTTQHQNEIANAKKEFSTDISKFKKQLEEFQVQLKSVEIESLKRFKIHDNDIKILLDIYNKGNSEKQKNSYNQEDSDIVSQFKNNNEQNMVDLFNIQSKEE